MIQKKQLKVLGISSADIYGGAARAAYRLHEAFVSYGIDSQLVVQRKGSDDYRVHGPTTKFDKLMAILRPTFDQYPLAAYPEKSFTRFSPAWFPSWRLINFINQSDADIIHLHSIAEGMLRIEDINKINKPIVWTIHDMWPFTGGCHYDESCGRYESYCHECPVLGSTKKNDQSRKVFKRKEACYSNVNDLTKDSGEQVRLHYVCTSEWLEGEARKSKLFQYFKGSIIPYALNVESFHAAEKKFARAVMRLPQGKKIILFGADSGVKDPRKGWAYLKKALIQIASKKNDTCCVVFGQSEPSEIENVGMPLLYQGALVDDVSLALLYSAADVMVVPSLQEAFGQTASEAQACGCPVVAFEGTGVASIVKHKETGYLANLASIEDLKKGILWCIEDVNRSAIISQAARANAVEKYAYDVISDSYMGIFSSILRY